ncbi:MAG: hypothetical protein ABEK75_03090 [Salinibacter sp.]
MRTGTITSISIIAGAALGTALVGFLGAYFALPAIAPSIAPDDPSEEVAATDSTGGPTPSSDTTGTVQAAAGNQNSRAGGDTTAMQPRQGDRAQDGGEPSTDASATSTPDDSSSAGRIQALRDSIDALRRRLQETKATADTLRNETETLREKLAAAETERAKVDELSSALMDMRRRNLSNLLQGVDMSVLKKLYQETTGQARTNLLQAMAPDQAAQFVNQVVEKDGEPSPLVAPDSASSTE